MPGLRSLMVEPTNRCNLNCPLCPSPNNMDRASGDMDPALFDRVIDDGVALGAQAIDLWNFGEPLLHPGLFRMIAAAEARGLRCRVSTNSTLFSDEIVQAIFESGLSEMIVCLDGATAETHERYRVGSSFEDVVRGIRRVARERRRRGLERPRLRLNFLVMAYNEHEVPAIAALGRRLGVDRLVLKNVSLGTWIQGPNRRGLVRNFVPANALLRKYDVGPDGRATLRGAGEPCPWAGADGVVLWNGDVTSCCYDADGRYAVGNVERDGGLAAVLASPAMERRRAEIRDRSLEICRECQYSPHRSVTVDLGGTRGFVVPAARRAVTSERIDVLVHSDHLIGLGHYARMRAIAAAAVARGLRVAWMLGSSVPDILPPPRGVEMISLPPVYEQGRPLPDEEERLHRTDLRVGRVVAELGRLRPRVLLLESFPFGRFTLLPELVHLVVAASELDPAPRLVCSVREYPALPEGPAREERLLDAEALLDEFFDDVLVHAAPASFEREETPWTRSWPTPIHYTGYVDGVLDGIDTRSGGEAAGGAAGRRIVVTAGSGAVGERLLEVAVDAAIAGRLGATGLTLVGGPRMPDATRTALATRAAAVTDLVMLDRVSSLRPVVRDAAMVISQAGYNACVDLLATAKPAVLVPVDASRDQLARARWLEGRGSAVMVREEELSVASLANAIERASRLTPPSGAPLDGAARTADRLAEWCAEP